MNPKSLVCQYKITLCDIFPAIWRRIQVPMTYTFWDLHVAIQDAMGWLDYHLHAFRFQKANRKKAVEIGIPTDEIDDRKTLPGWGVGIAEFFTEPGCMAIYEYDFGDGWEHEVLLEGILLKEKDVNYPWCMAGERACPPEDCGGVPGYDQLLETLADPAHEEYQQTIEWLKGHLKNYHPYHPDAFEPGKVHFDKPKKRWKMAFGKS